MSEFYSDDEFVPEDPELVALRDEVREAWQEDPAVTAARIATTAAEQEMAELRPIIDSVHAVTRDHRYGQVRDETVRWLDEKFPVRFDQEGRGRNVVDPGWRPYAEAMQEQLDRHFGEYAWSGDPEAVRQRAEMVYRQVKPHVDAQQQQSEWESVRAAGSDPYWKGPTQ